MRNGTFETKIPPQLPRFNLRSLVQSTVLPVALTLILFIGTTFFLAIPTIKDTLLESRKGMIRELTNAVWSLLNSYDQKVRDGEISLQEAQERALSHIRIMQFGPDRKDYFWINNFQPRMIMHPYRSELEGQYLDDYTDENGVFLFRDFVKTVEKSGEGFVSYLWQWQDDEEQIREKLSFVKAFEPWGWIIGTGIYPHEVNQQIEKVTVPLRTALLVILLIVALLSIYTIRHAQNLEEERLHSMKLWLDSDARYRTLVESMNEGMVIQSEDNSLAYVNESFCKMVGYTRKELEGRDIHDFLDEKNSALLDTQTRLRKETGESSLYGLTVLAKDSKPVYTLISGRPYCDQNREFTGTFALIIDVTEQTKKDLALKENEEKFRAVFEISPNLIILLRTRDGFLKDANKAFCDLCGLNKSAILGRKVLDLDIFEESTDRERLVKKAITKRQLVNESLKLVRADGNIIHLLLSTKSIRLNGESHTVCFARDITDKIEAEEKYHSIVHTMKDGYAEFDLKGRFLFCNKALSDILGFDRQEIVNVDYTQYVTAEETQRMKNLFGKVYKTGESIEAIELEYLTKDQDTGYLEFSVVPVLDNQGRPSAFSCFFRDVTARRKSDQEMEDMRLLFKNAIDLMPSVLIVVDKNLKITQWNMEAEKVTGIPSYSAAGSDFVAVMGNFSQHADHIRKVIAENRPYKFERIATTQNDESRIYDIMIYPIHSSALEGAALRIDDITSRVRMEEMMIQSEKMMSIGELAAGTAHEINNPLGGILHAAQLIERRLTPDRKKNHELAHSFGLDLEKLNQFLETQKIHHYIDGIRKSGMRAADIVSRMLQFSRISQSQMTVVELPELLERSLALAGSDFDLKKKYDFKGIRIVKDYEADLPALPCIAMEIEQVLLNLFKNAAQAMSEKALVDSRFKPTLTISLRNTREFIEMQIRDNGPGMDEQVRKKVFQPFFTTKPIGEGTGLGLSVSYMIITNNHKGAMEVSVTPGGGSTFIIRLPLNQSSITDQNS